MWFLLWFQRLKMLKISTFNIQNDFDNYNKKKTLEIINYLKNNNIDILGLQEVYSKLNNDLEQELSTTKYKIYGKYRFYLHTILKRFNEKVPIITKKKTIFNKTYHLPNFPSPLKRIVTKVIISHNNKNISIYNTHLDFMFDNVKKKELKKLYNLIENDNNYIILMGDFNLKNNNPIFNQFTALLESKKIYKIELNEKTLKKSKYHREIDHIFLSNEIKLIKKEVIKDLKISDHYPVLVCVDV